MAGEAGRSVRCPVVAGRGRCADHRAGARHRARPIGQQVHRVVRGIPARAPRGRRPRSPSGSSSSNSAAMRFLVRNWIFRI